MIFSQIFNTRISIIHTIFHNSESNLSEQFQVVGMKNQNLLKEIDMSLTFEKVSDFDRGTLHKLLVDGYSFDDRWRTYCEKDWIEFDKFFFNNLDIADKYGFVTVLDGEPIGHISWDHIIMKA
jgi:hypothetical protein